MERELGIERQDAADAAQDRDDDLAWIAGLPPCPGIGFADDDMEEADRRARADIAAGRGVPHEQVASWIMKLGTPDEEPMPPEWLA